MEASYNKVPIWDYAKLCETFGPSFPSKYYRIETGDELLKLLSDPKFNAAECTQVTTESRIIFPYPLANNNIQVVELILGKHDAPMPLKMATQAVEEFNKRQ